MYLKCIKKQFGFCLNYRSENPLWKTLQILTFQSFYNIFKAINFVKINLHFHNISIHTNNKMIKRIHQD